MQHPTSKDCRRDDDVSLELHQMRFFPLKKRIIQMLLCTVKRNGFWDFRSMIKLNLEYQLTQEIAACSKPMYLFMNALSSEW